MVTIPHRPLAIYLTWLIKAIDSIVTYTQSCHTYEEFVASPMIIDAVLMQLQHIGETCVHIRKRYPDFDGFETDMIIGMRNYLSHNYLGIDKQVIRETITYDIPQLYTITQSLVQQQTDQQ